MHRRGKVTLSAVVIQKWNKGGARDLKINQSAANNFRLVLTGWFLQAPKLTKYCTIKTIHCYERNLFNALNLNLPHFDKWCRRKCFFIGVVSFLGKEVEISCLVSVTILGHAVPVHWVSPPLQSPEPLCHLLLSSFDLGRDCLVWKRIRLLSGAKHQIRAPPLLIPSCAWLFHHHGLSGSVPAPDSVWTWSVFLAFYLFWM